MPDKLPPEEMYAFHGLQAETHLSITHLEILHAAMQSIPTKDGKAEPICQQAFFYFRDPQCVPTPQSLTGLADDERTEHAKAFFEELPQRTTMLEHVKNDIRERYANDHRVFDYSGQWNSETLNPEDDKLKGRLTGLEDFGKRIEADLKRGIEEQFFEHIASLGAAIDPLEVERSYHEAFIENRTQVHVARTDVENKLSNYVAGNENRPMVLSGPPGSGKSAILAHWVRERSRVECRVSRAELFIPRFIGASTSSVNLHRLLGNICAELQSRFELTEEVQEEQGGQKTTKVLPMQVPADPMEIQQKWPKFLEATAEKGSVIIVLDAINQLDHSADPMRLYWLPRELPDNVRIIVSALDHGERSAAESFNRAPTGSASQEPLDWLSVMRRMKLPEVQVPELSDDQRREMIRQLPSVFCKTLDEQQIDSLLENQATRNPLFLFVALEELRVFGSFEKLAARMSQLPAADPNDPQAMQEALDAMFGQVLDRLQDETDSQTPELSSNLFRLLASARDGLSEEELGAVLHQVLPNIDADEIDQQMQIVLRQVRPYLVRKGVDQRLSELDNPADDFDEDAPADEVSIPTTTIALVDLYHRSFWKAIRAKYLLNADIQAESHRQLATYFANDQSQPYFLESLESQRRRAKRLPPTPRPGNVRKVVELPYHLLEVAKLVDPESKNPEAKEWDAVADLLTNWQFLEAKAEA